jgi:hypothetical protein
MNRGAVKETADPLTPTLSSPVAASIIEATHPINEVGEVHTSLLAVSSWGPSAACAAALAVSRAALRELGLRRR